MFLAGSPRGWWWAPGRAGGHYTEPLPLSPSTGLRVQEGSPRGPEDVGLMVEATPVGIGAAKKPELGGRTG